MTQPEYLADIGHELRALNDTAAMEDAVVGAQSHVALLALVVLFALLLGGSAVLAVL